MALVLLILNIAMIAFFMITKPRPLNGHPPKQRAGALAQLNLDEGQKEAFEKLRDTHQKEMSTLNQEHQELLKEYFKQSLAPISIEKEKDLLDRASAIADSKIISTKEHFEDIRMLLRKDQQGAFEQFVNRAMAMILGLPNQPAPRQ